MMPVFFISSTFPVAKLQKIYQTAKYFAQKFAQFKKM
jgi:hypothetical protein